MPTMYQTLSFLLLSFTIYILKFLEAGRPRSGYQHGWVLARALFPGLQTDAFLRCAHVVERGQARSSVSLLRRALVL